VLGQPATVRCRPGLWLSLALAVWLAACAAPPQLPNAGGSPGSPPQPPNSGGSPAASAASSPVAGGLPQNAGSVGSAAAGAPAVAATAPPAPIRVTVNWTAPAGVFAPFWAAQDAGIFREQGLDVNLVNIPGTAQAGQAMVAGEVPISSLDPAAAMQANVNGADLVMLYAQTNGLNFAIMSLPSIADPEALRGKTLGISRIGSASHTGALVALQAWGLEPDRDVSLRQLGDFGNVLPAFETGQLDAATIGLPLRRDTRARFHQLMNVMTEGPPFPTTTITAPRAWVAANEEAVRRFGRAWVASIHRVKRDKPLGLELIHKYLQLDDPEVVEDEYEHAAASLPDVPYVSEDGVGRVLEFLVPREPALAGHQATEWIDSRFMRELDQSGFVRQVVGR
jgi:NitT/TauT family transport system substrate-binding protein